ncbi:MAG TPA: sigma-54-dependent Fis family transcriptional regulator [Steroidobacteraceae bacterium]|nr:sigma-54-dependent Fis family transcriptional regulator [Steroidobacteraceae bacterium]
MSGHAGGPHADLVVRVAEHGFNVDSAAPVTPIVDVSWRRCLHDFKLDPAREYQPTVLDFGRLKDLHAEHDELVQIARAEMDSLYEQISGSGYALLLADTEGVILCEKVDPGLKRMFGQAGLILGAEWSERREGTNGIGTCAAEARPVTIHEADHFRARHVALSCSAAPIHDPNGKLLAVLDASCVNAGGTRESQMHTVALVDTSARLIEKCLFLRRHRGDAMLRFHHRPEFVDLLHDGAIAVAADGRIVAADMTGLKLLGAQDRGDLIGCSIAEVFDTTYDELLATCAAGRRAVWELRDNRFGRRYYASMVGAGTQAGRAPPPIVPRAVVQVARDESCGAMTLADLAGEDPQMRRNLRNARRIADSSVAVVIFGPTGSGKEAFAKALHLASSRAKQPFVPVNCAAIPETLIESELFGYSRGAFTGAKKEGMRGRIVQSSGGTLFLDEIGDMPLMAQTRLLRVLEEMEVTPLGSEAPIKVNLRVMCASHRNLRELMSRGEFREDLYYRLNGICMELPPLALRGDKEVLIGKCIARESAGKQIAAIEEIAMKRLLAYPWPGNIRELRNAIRTAIAICDHNVIRFADLPLDVRRHVPASCNSGDETSRRAATIPANSLQSAERQALLQVIEQLHWNMTMVAEQLKISRNTLYRKIKRHAIPIARGGGVTAKRSERRTA